MNQGMFVVEFIILCIIQLVAIGFSSINFICGFRRYLHTDSSEIILRKSIKYFSFIFLTITVAGIFSMITNFYYLSTKNGFLAGYIYACVTTNILGNVFCAWQFITYLIHPERRNIKYIVGIYCLIGIILIWVFAPTVTNVLYTPNLQYDFLYIYIWSIFAFVWFVFTLDFFRHSLKAVEKKEKYRFFCLGLSGLCALAMFPLAFFGQIFSWLIILITTILLYLGYNFPKFFQKYLKI